MFTITLGRPRNATRESIRTSSMLYVDNVGTQIISIPSVTSATRYLQNDGHAGLWHELKRVARTDLYAHPHHPGLITIEVKDAGLNLELQRGWYFSCAGTAHYNHRHIWVANCGRTADIAMAANNK